MVVVFVRFVEREEEGVVGGGKKGGERDLRMAWPRFQLSSWRWLGCISVDRSRIDKEDLGLTARSD